MAPRRRRGLKPPRPSGDRVRQLFRVRTLTAGVPLKNLGDLHSIESALDFLALGKQRFEAAGYEVETLRIALNPLLGGLSSAARMDAMKDLQKLDAMVSARGALLSIGPAFTAGDSDEHIGEWATELVRGTKSINFSGSVASSERGASGRHRDGGASHCGADYYAARRGWQLPFRCGGLCRPQAHLFSRWPTPPFSLIGGGTGNPRLLQRAFGGGGDPLDASERLRALLDEKFLPVQTLAAQIAEHGKRVYLGIDTSPAPVATAASVRRSKTLTEKASPPLDRHPPCRHAPRSAAIKSVSVKTCGYSGLMLPILEDPVLADRVAEGRIKISDLLLYSTVCGTGLDVVPLAGDCRQANLARVIGDVATLAVQLKKPLSARLFRCPAKKSSRSAATRCYACKSAPLEA